MSEPSSEHVSTLPVARSKRGRGAIAAPLTQLRAQEMAPGASPSASQSSRRSPPAGPQLGPSGRPSRRRDPAWSAAQRQAARRVLRTSGWPVGGVCLSGQAAPTRWPARPTRAPRWPAMHPPMRCTQLRRRRRRALPRLPRPRRHRPPRRRPDRRPTPQRRTRLFQQVRRRQSLLGPGRLVPPPPPQPPQMQQPHEASHRPQCPRRPCSQPAAALGPATV
jgi:hypothetical protein